MGKYHARNTGRKKYTYFLMGKGNAPLVKYEFKKHLLPRHLTTEQ
jgi:hypothetical protein